MNLSVWRYRMQSILINWLTNKIGFLMTDGNDDGIDTKFGKLMDKLYAPPHPSPPNGWELIGNEENVFHNLFFSISMVINWPLLFFTQSM